MKRVKKIIMNITLDFIVAIVLYFLLSIVALVCSIKVPGFKDSMMIHEFMNCACILGIASLGVSFTAYLIYIRVIEGKSQIKVRLDTIQ